MAIQHDNVMKILWKQVGMRHYHTGWWRGGLEPSTRGMITSNTWLGQVVPVLVKRTWKLFHALLDTDQRLTVCELALEIGLLHMTVFSIVKKRLGM